MNSKKVIIENFSQTNLAVIKLEPDDFKGYNLSVPKQTEGSSSSSQLSQNVAKSCNNKSGKVLLD